LKEEAKKSKKATKKAKKEGGFDFTILLPFLFLFCPFYFLFQNESWKEVKLMARRKSPTLTEVELELMDVLWEKGNGTVSEIVEALPEERLAYSSVLTMMRILEQKGYVTHEKEGRAFVYRPLVDRQQAQRSVIGYLLKRFFNNSPELLVVNLLESEDVDPDEVKRLKEMIEKEK
jgi:predicted transcriptional regulator